MDAYSSLITHTLGCFKHMHPCIKMIVRLLSCVETPRTSQQCPTFSLEYSDDGRSLKPQVSNGCAVGWWNYNLWQTLRNFQKCARFSQKFGALLQSLHEHDLQMIHQNKLCFQDSNFSHPIFTLRLFQAFLMPSRCHMDQASRIRWAFQLGRMCEAKALFRQLSRFFFCCRKLLWTGATGMTIGEEAQLEVPEIQQFRDQMIKTSIFSTTCTGLKKKTCLLLLLFFNTTHR